MLVRLNSQTGADVPSPHTTLQQIHDQLLAQQQCWADQLANDPASFAQLEPQVHRAFQQLADRLVASLLAHTAEQPALQAQAKKK
jgi:hypothetical protein